MSNNWKLEYEVMKDGTIAYGNVNSLLNKVQKGANVKIEFFKTEKQPITFVCNNPSIVFDKNKISCEHHHIGLLTNLERPYSYIFEKDYFYHIIAINTAGEGYSARWKHGEKEPLEEKFNEQYRSKWFVEEPIKWKLAYEIQQDGAITYGNVDALINKVKEGANIKIAYDNSKEVLHFRTCTEVLYTEKGVTCGPTTGMAFGAARKTPYHYYSLINSDSFEDVSRWTYGSHTGAGHTQERLHEKWFVEEQNKNTLHIAKIGQADKIIIEKSTTIAHKIASTINLEQCKNIILNLNPLEGDTMDLSHYGQFTIDQVSFETFQTIKTPTNQIPVSGIKISGEEDYVACVYGFDADKFFAPDYVDPDTGAPHMLNTHDVITFLQAQNFHGEL